MQYAHQCEMCRAHTVNEIASHANDVLRVTWDVCVNQSVRLIYIYIRTAYSICFY